MAADIADWLLRSTLALSLAICAVMALRPIWRRLLGSVSVLWLWLLLPAALVATSLPRPTLVTETTDAYASQAIETGLAGPAVAVERAAAVEDAAATVESAILASTLPPAPARIAGLASTPGRLPAALIGAWCLGALGLAAMMVRQQRAFRRRLGNLSAREDGIYLASTRSIGPAVVGALRPRIVVPADFEQRYDAQQRTLVLAHERVHLRRGDLQVNLLLCALRCVFWFNPLVHLASRRLRLDQELACDATVLRQHPHAGRAYATALLNTQLADLGLPVGCYWQSSHPLKWRIAMLKRPLPGSARLLLGAGFALLASSAAAVTLWQAQPVQTVVLPAASVPMRAPMSALSLQLAPVATVRPIAALSLPEVVEAAPADPARDVAVEAVAPAPSATPLPPPAATQAAPAPATAVEPTFIGPKVTKIWLADPPQRLRQRDFKREGSGGSLVLQVEVDAQGIPGHAEVAKNDLGERYERGALRAIKRWRFEPARRDGVAVASTILVPVAFDLRQSSMDRFWDDAMRHPRMLTSPIDTAPAGTRVNTAAK